MESIIKYDSKGNVCGIETAKLVNCLQDLGYAKIAADEMLYDSTLVRVSGKLIERCSLDEVRILALQMTNGTIEEQTAVYNSSVLSKKFVNWLNKETVVAFKDTKDACHFFFKNGVLKILKNGTERFCSLDEIEVGESKIWKTSVLDMEYRAFGRTDYKDGVFYKFCRNAVGENGIEYLMRAIGYLLHSYKDPSIPKAVIFSEANQDDSMEANGGTGKSIIAKDALSIFRNLSTVDCKSYDPKNRFKFQGIKEESDIAALEDVKYNFEYNDIYNFLTGDAEFERKNLSTIIVPFERSPKFVITTNYGIPASGSSDQRRRCVIGFLNHYSAKHTPYDEFGHILFKDWKGEREDEWQYFFMFMKECVKLYFEKGIESYNHTKIESVALRKFFGSELFDYCLLNYGSYCGKINAKSQKDIYESLPNHIRIQFRSQEEFTAKFNRMMKAIGIECNVYKNEYVTSSAGRYHVRTYLYTIVDSSKLSRILRDMNASGIRPSEPSFMQEDEVEAPIREDFKQTEFDYQDIDNSDYCPF